MDKVDIPASVRPHTGPAITLVKSNTRTPSNGILPGAVNRTETGASPVLVNNTGEKLAE